MKHKQLTIVAVSLAAVLLPAHAMAQSRPKLHGARDGRGIRVEVHVQRRIQEAHKTDAVGFSPDHWRLMSPSRRSCIALSFGEFGS
jgi:hypothetical protein